MGNLSDFFNRSKFEARALTANKHAVEPDTLYKLELEIYDVLVLDTPAVVTATIATQVNRTVTVLPTVVSTSSFGSFSYLLEFTVAAIDWNGTDPLIVRLEVTDHDAYVYKLDYQLKV